MIQANQTVWKETGYIAAWIGILSLVMQVVFIIASKWNYTVLLGNIWGAAIMILNFFFMGISVQKAVAADEKEAKKIMQLSHSLRTLSVFALVVVGVVLPWFSTIATICPLFFPRIAIALRPLKKVQPKEEEVPRQNEIK